MRPAPTRRSDVLLAALPPAEPELAAQRVALLVQACEATAALVRGGLERPLEDVLRETPPVRATKRLSPDGDWSCRRCRSVPGRAVSRRGARAALAAGV